MTTINAAQNPDLANNLIEQALNGSASSEATPPPSPAAPNDTTVVLPGGYQAVDGTVYGTGEVRELTGVDEEALAKAAGNRPKMIETLLQRGVVSIGPEKATPTLLAGVLMGDLDALLLGVRRATFGDDLKFDAVCPACSEQQVIVVDLSKDVPTRTLDLPADRYFNLDCPSGRRVAVSLPDGDAQKAISQSPDRNYGRLNTILLHKCVREINNFPAVSEAQVRDLPLRDRDFIIDEIAKRNPGPRLEEVSRPCAQCNEEIPVPLSLADLFRML